MSIWVKERPPAPWRGGAATVVAAVPAVAGIPGVPGVPGIPVEPYHVVPAEAYHAVPLEAYHATPTEPFHTEVGLSGLSAKAVPYLQAKAPLLPQQAPPPPQLTAPRPANRFTLAEYKARLTAIYAVHKQDNVPKVDYLLQKYSGQEEYLFQIVCQKYLIDPDAVPAPPPVKAQPPTPAAHRVVEWDPATGSYLETTIEFDAYPEEVAAQLRSFSQKPTTVSLLGAEDGEEEEEYDPFSTGPDQTPKDSPEAMVQIDMLLLGERSYFFEDEGPKEVSTPVDLTSVLTDKTNHTEAVEEEKKPTKAEQEHEAAEEEKKRAKAEQKHEAATEEKQQAKADQGQEAATEEKQQAKAEQGHEAAKEEKQQAKAEQGHEVVAEEKQQATSAQGHEAVAEEKQQATAAQGHEAVAEEKQQATAEQGHEVGTQRTAVPMEVDTALEDAVAAGLGEDGAESDPAEGLEASFDPYLLAEDEERNEEEELEALAALGGELSLAEGAAA